MLGTLVKTVAVAVEDKTVAVRYFELRTVRGARRYSAEIPTPACSATAEIGAAGFATNTALALSRIRVLFRTASARRPLNGTDSLLMEPSVALERSIPFYWRACCHPDSAG